MRHLTEDHKRKIGEATRLRNIRLGLVPPNNKGKKFSLEHRKKISLANLGKSRNYKRKITLEQRMRMSESRRGSKCNFWKGGVTAKNKLIRSSLEYKEWRKSVFIRDGYICRNCGAKSIKGRAVELHPHHIKPFAYFPKLRFEISNGITLCIDCHKLTESYAGKARLLYERSTLWL